MKKKSLFVLIAMLMLFVVSCGGKHPAVRDFEKSMKLISTGDLDKIPNGKEQFRGLSAETAKAFVSGYKKMTYKINKTDVKKDTVTINVTMKSPDLSDVMPEYMQKVATSQKNFVGKTQQEIQNEVEKMLQQIISDKLNDKNLKYNEKTFDVIYHKNGKGWILSANENPEYAELMTFGLMKTN